MPVFKTFSAFKIFESKKNKTQKVLESGYTSQMWCILEVYGVIFRKSIPISGSFVLSSQHRWSLDVSIFIPYFTLLKWCGIWNWHGHFQTVLHDCLAVAHLVQCLPRYRWLQLPKLIKQIFFNIGRMWYNEHIHQSMAMYSISWSIVPSSLVVEISIELCTCCSSRCTLQWIC